jgi:hypothetical protein
MYTPSCVSSSLYSYPSASQCSDVQTSLKRILQGALSLPLQTPRVSISPEGRLLSTILKSVRVFFKTETILRTFEAIGI